MNAPGGLRQPARGKLEAVLRIAALTQRAPERLGPGSKERKSVLLNLAADLGLEVDPRASKPLLGDQIATLLGATWDRACWSTGSTITLEGLNRILLTAEDRVQRQRTAPQLEFFASELGTDGPFIPAQSKLEAVTRISALTGAPPEALGPGSKERKRALKNLAEGLGLTVDLGAPKPELGEAICSALGMAWDDSCHSTGDTVTLLGLNRLIEGAERWLAGRGRATRGMFLSFREEGMALLGVLSEALPHAWEGRACVEEMRDAEYSQWAQDEWAAFFFEYKGLPALINAFGGGPRLFANTRFDYGLAHPWDLKVHMADSASAPLNDQVAMNEALADGRGVGFLVLTGQVEYDDGDFRAWQRDFRAKHGKVAKLRLDAPKYVRKSKPRFIPSILECFFIADREALDDALTSGVMREMKQGRQTSGAPRPPKYAINLVKARWGGRLLVGQVPR